MPETAAMDGACATTAGATPARTGGGDYEYTHEEKRKSIPSPRSRAGEQRVSGLRTRRVRSTAGFAQCARGAPRAFDDRRSPTLALCACPSPASRGRDLRDQSCTSDCAAVGAGGSVFGAFGLRNRFHQPPAVHAFSAHFSQRSSAIASHSDHASIATRYTQIGTL